ncbi:ABC transporter permease [Pendulispora rubella]|uniref:ABC transporter permease n=1 Tax=Pendulispora rubella TaxID=2741070 RepID=A0ABZ2L2E1_9BACT
MTFHRLLSSPMVRAMLALVGMLLLGTLLHADGAFFHWATHRDMLRQISVCGIIACGMTLVVITGGIDLSVSSVLASSAVGFSLLTIHLQANPWLAIVLVLLAGALVGSITGVLVGRFAIQPFVVTLAAMVLLRGLAKRLSGGQKISTYVAASDRNVELPRIFELIDARVLGDEIAIVTVILFVCVAVSAFLLRRTRLGRYFYATGGNIEAARLSGVPVMRTLVLAYALSGLFAAVAGICQAAQEQQGDPETSVGYELQAIAIVVIGGTNLSGGRGGMGLTLAGALTIGYLQKILSINAVGEASRLMLTGIIIVCAVLLQRRK